MKTILACSFVALAVSACAPADPVQTQAAADRAEMRLEDAVRGRMADAPVSCVNQRLLRGNRSAGEGAIIFEGSNGLVYVNRPPAGCPELDSSRTLITRTSTGQLCRGDIVTIVDPVSSMNYGSCGLGDFTPYRRAG